jgi:predicted metal-dependent peptidase
VLHLVLDTSGSMSEELPAVLGAIAGVGANAGVGVVHVLQCDVAVTVEDWLEPEALERYEIHGFGGSDLSLALARLADDPGVEAAVGVTDGVIDYPAEPPPFAVLWAVVDGGDPNFQPPYGQVIALPNRLEL